MLCFALIKIGKTAGNIREKLGSLFCMIASLWREIENFAPETIQSEAKDLVESGTYRRDPSSFHSSG